MAKKTTIPPMPSIVYSEEMSCLLGEVNLTSSLSQDFPGSFSSIAAAELQYEGRVSIFG